MAPTLKTTLYVVSATLVVFYAANVESAPSSDTPRFDIAERIVSKIKSSVSKSVENTMAKPENAKDDAESRADNYGPNGDNYGNNNGKPNGNYNNGGNKPSGNYGNNGGNYNNGEKPSGNYGNNGGNYNNGGNKPSGNYGNNGGNYNGNNGGNNSGNFYGSGDNYGTPDVSYTPQDPPYSGNGNGNENGNGNGNEGTAVMTTTHRPPPTIVGFGTVASSFWDMVLSFIRAAMGIQRKQPPRIARAFLAAAAGREQCLKTSACHAGRMMRSLLIKDQENKEDKEVYFVAAEMLSPEGWKPFVRGMRRSALEDEDCSKFVCTA